MGGLERLIQSLQIFAKYNPNALIGAEHDKFFVYDRALLPEYLTPEDRATLEGLGWAFDEEQDAWYYFT